MSKLNSWTTETLDLTYLSKVELKCVKWYKLKWCKCGNMSFWYFSLRAKVFILSKILCVGYRRIEYETSDFPKMATTTLLEFYHSNINRGWLYLLKTTWFSDYFNKQSAAEICHVTSEAMLKKIPLSCDSHSYNQPPYCEENQVACGETLVNSVKCCTEYSGYSRQHLSALAMFMWKVVS